MHSLMSRAAKLLVQRAALAFALGLAAVNAAAAPRTVPDTLAQRTQACTACHGEQGRATPDGYFPRIAGKPAGYLHQQLLHFRDGRRHNGHMVTMVEHLSDAYLRDIAQHYAARDLPYPPPQTRDAPAAVLQRGEALVRRGDPARQLPACTQCHGDAMTGVQPAMPGLLGLPRDYLIGQLGAWQTGQRRAAAPDCMAQVARALSAQDISAVATWLSSQPLPADTHAVAASPRPLPIDCGSARP